MHRKVGVGLGDLQSNTAVLVPSGPPGMLVSELHALARRGSQSRFRGRKQLLGARQTSVCQQLSRKGTSMVVGAFSEDVNSGLS